jgi:acyl dehydratase
MPLYFEDIAVGDLVMTDTYTPSKSEIIEFAEEFDPQPFHVDEAAAEDSIFDGIVASGLHTFCLTVRLTNEALFERTANMAGEGMDGVRFREPVYPGDTIRAEIEASLKEPIEEYGTGRITHEIRTENGEGEEVLRYRAFGIYQRRPDSDESNTDQSDT